MCYSVPQIGSHPGLRTVQTAQKDCRGQGFIVAPFSQVDRAVLLATDVGVTPKRETFLLFSQVQAQVCSASNYRSQG